MGSEKQIQGLPLTFPRNGTSCQSRDQYTDGKEQTISHQDITLNRKTVLQDRHIIFSSAQSHLCDQGKQSQNQIHTKNNPGTFHISCVTFHFIFQNRILPVIGLVLIYGGITLVNLFQLILNLVITGIFIGSIGIFYSAIMRKTTVAVILSYVTVVLLVLGTVGILFGIGYIQQMRGMYREDFTGIRLGGLVYLLYFNPAVTLYGLIGQQTTNAYGLVRLCGHFGDYSHSFGVEHMVELSILVQLGCSALLLIAAGRHIHPMRK